MILNYLRRFFKIILFRLKILNHISKLKNIGCNRRKSKRKIDLAGNIIEIRKQEACKKKSEKIIKATIVDYSLRGCGLVIQSEQSPRLGEAYELNIVKLDFKSIFIVGEVVWYQKLAYKTYRIGLKYKEII